MSCTVGEMEKRLEVPSSTLRYYDKEGLLPFVERSSGGIRIFQEADFEWLNLIGCLKRTGMSIKDIKAFIDLCMEGDSTIDQRLDLINKQRVAVLQQISQLKDTLHTLDFKHWYYQTAKEAGTCHIHDHMQAADIPEDLRDAFTKIKNMDS